MLDTPMLECLKKDAKKKTRIGRSQAKHAHKRPIEMNRKELPGYFFEIGLWFQKNVKSPHGGSS